MYSLHCRVSPEQLLYECLLIVPDTPPSPGKSKSPDMGYIRSGLTCMTAIGNILPVCQILVMVPSAGIPAMTRLPEADWASCSVGSSHISSPRLH